MSELKDFYVKIGHEPERLENSMWYLSQLALRAATEIDNYLLGRNQDFSHLQELAGILGKYQLKDSHHALTEPNFHYLPLWRAIRTNSDKDTRKYSELALEMRLLRSELEDIPDESKRLEEMRTFLCNLSGEFFNEQQRYYPPHRLVA